MSARAAQIAAPTDVFVMRHSPLAVPCCAICRTTHAHSTGFVHFRSCKICGGGLVCIERRESPGVCSAFGGGGTWKPSLPAGCRLGLPPLGSSNVSPWTSTSSSRSSAPRCSRISARRPRITSKRYDAKKSGLPPRMAPCASRTEAEMMRSAPRSLVIMAARLNGRHMQSVRGALVAPRRGFPLLVTCSFEARVCQERDHYDC